MTQPTPWLAGRRLALILNKQAGAMLAGADPEATLRASLTDAGATLVDTDPQGEPKLPDRLRAALASHADAILVVGGDGTIACAAQLLTGTDTALAIIPAGTMNLLARDLRLPTDDLPAATQALTRAAPRPIDVGEVADKIFTCACMMGTPAHIGHHREQGRKQGNGPLAWLRVAAAALRIARHDRRLRLTLTIDGQTYSRKTAALTITVNALDDASGRAFGRTQLDGGQLCAYILHGGGSWRLLRLIAHLLLGTTKDPALERLAGRSIEVASPIALRILIDGEEHLLPAPLRFSLRPKALTVLA